MKHPGVPIDSTIRRLTDGRTDQSTHTGEESGALRIAESLPEVTEGRRSAMREWKRGEGVAAARSSRSFDEPRGRHELPFPEQASTT